MIPTWRLVGLVLATAVPLALATWWPDLLLIAVVWLLLILALVLVDMRLTPGASQWTVERAHDARLSVAAWNRVVVQVRLGQGLRDLHVWLRDQTPASFAVTATTPPVQTTAADRLLSGVCQPGQSATFVYHVRPPRRGDYTFGDLYLRWQSIFGLIRRQARFPATAPVKVYPNLVDVRRYDLLLRRNRLWELGLRQTRVLGAGQEFERLRDYQPDDEYRRINWKATARRGRPISAEFETERTQNIMALVDVGRMMRSPVGDVSKLDYAINAVLLLAYVTAHKGDRIGMLTFADTVQQWLVPRGGTGQFQRMLEFLYRVEGQPVEPDYGTAFAYFAARQSKRSLVIVFTDLTGTLGMQSLVAHMARLRQRHLPLLVTLRDPTVQHLAQQPVVDSQSLYERTVAEQLLDERRLVLDRLRHQGVLTLDVPANELSVALINKYLELKSGARI